MPFPNPSQPKRIHNSKIFGITLGHQTKTFSLLGGNLKCAFPLGFLAQHRDKTIMPDGPCVGASRYRPSPNPKQQQINLVFRLHHARFTRFCFVNLTPRNNFGRLSLLQTSWNGHLRRSESGGICHTVILAQLIHARFDSRFLLAIVDSIPQAINREDLR